MAPATPDANLTFDTAPLHDLAHAAVHAQRDEDGWWGHQMETALVAVADSQHSEGARAMAEPAYEQLLDWLGEEEPRAIGDDAAAMALAARAGLELRGGNNSLTAQAVEVVASACRGHELALAPLHVALMAWALDPLVGDRRQQPWDEIRSALDRFSMQGINDAFVRFARTLADGRRPALDPRLAETTVSNRTEECLLLWVLVAAIRVEVDSGRGNDDALQPVLRRRTELLDHLAGVVTGEALAPVSVPDYDPFAEAFEEAAGLHLFEAIMLDLALSGERPRQQLITLEEAARLGLRAGEGRQRTYAKVGVAATVLLTGMAVAIAILAEAATRLWVGLGIMLLALGIAGSLLFLRKTETKWSLEFLLTGLILESLLGAFFLVEGVFDEVIVSDELAGAIGLGALGLPMLVQAVSKRLLKK